MVFYLLLYFLFIITVFFNFFNLKNLSKLFFIVSALFSIFVISFKGMVGGYDLYFYSKYFELVGDNGNIYNYEIGYYYFNMLISFFTTDRTIFFGLIGLIFVLSHVYFSIKIDPKNYPIIVFILFLKFYLVAFTYFRQILAIGFYILSIYYLFKNAKIKAILLLILASIFHSSLILGFISLFFNKKIINKYIVVVWYLFGLIFSLFLYFTKFASYISNKFEYNINFLYIFESILILLFLYALHDFFKKSKLILFYNLSVVFCFLEIFAAFLGGDFIRIIWIFYFCPIVCIVYYMGFIKKTKPIEALIFLVIVLFYFTVTAIKYLYGFDEGSLMNYVTIFNIMSDQINKYSYLDYQ